MGKGGERREGVRDTGQWNTTVGRHRQESFALGPSRKQGQETGMHCMLTHMWRDFTHTVWSTDHVTFQQVSE